MGKNLVIVESPAKARTINRYLGKDFVVKACMGHVRDLPEKTLGVDIEGGFVPEYKTIRGKGKTLTDLRKAAQKAEKIYIASDFDREGEAIGWHIKESMPKVADNIWRIVFSEITKRGIQHAIENPLRINEKMVNAQQARRILDRLVGYKISPILWTKVKRGLSAGRVQSVAVRLICEREEEIRNFKTEEYWSIDAIFETEEKETLKASLHQIAGEKSEIGNEEAAKKILAGLEGATYAVTKIAKKEVKRRPHPPFITSALQQQASITLGFTPSRTMHIAQSLYEGVELGNEGSVGLITYMRTDSVRIAGEAVHEAREYIEANYGREYLPQKPRNYKNKGRVQDAHEAIRPTSPNRTPDSVAQFLDKNQLALYRLIWNRFMATQMSDAELEQTSVDITAKEQYLFRATGSVIQFPGWLKIYHEDIELNDENKETMTRSEAEEKFIPPLREGQPLTEIEMTPNQHFTKPPSRYSEASLVRALEEKGIGRPSTYATIVKTIQDREYVEREKRRLKPTELGDLVNSLLVESFPEILDVGFTAEMETKLDAVEEGKVDWQILLKEFYGPFETALESARTNMRNVKQEAIPTDEVCEKCGNPMVIRWGRFGKFLACKSYPECKNTRNLDDNEEGEDKKREVKVAEGKKCRECGSDMVYRKGRYGMFLGCSGYPDCKYLEPIGTGFKCPKDGCSGELVERRTKKNRKFFGCSRYPKCDFASWHKPIAESCPDCGAPYVFEKSSRDGKITRYCGKESCEFKLSVEQQASA